MRLEFMEPEPGKQTPAMIRDLMGLVGVQITLATLEEWTWTERVIAFDWAIREHLAASDNPVRRRPKPWFVTVAQEDEEDDPAEARMREHVRQALFRYPEGASPMRLLQEDELSGALQRSVRVWLEQLETSGRAREFTPGLWIAVPDPLEKEMTEHAH
jgi:hypothetical protein